MPFKPLRVSIFPSRSVSAKSGASLPTSGPVGKVVAAGFAVAVGVVVGRAVTVFVTVGGDVTVTVVVGGAVTVTVVVGVTVEVVSVGGATACPHPDATSIKIKLMLASNVMNLLVFITPHFRA